MHAGLKKKLSFIKNTNDIPIFPFVVPKLVNIMGDPRTNAKDLVEVISTDQGLASRVLQLANSAYYGFVREIDTIHRAIVILGFNTVISLSISSAMGKMFDGIKSSRHLPTKDLWAHSMGTAVCCKLIAHETGLFEKETSFIAGLFHDVGKLVESYYLREEVDSIFNLIEDEECSFLEAEKKILGIEHPEIGSELFETWNFPLNLTKSIRFHHKPEESQELDIHILSSIINYGDFLANENGFKCPLNISHSTLLENAVESLGCSPRQVKSVKTNCVRELEHATQFLHLPSFL